VLPFTNLRSDSQAQYLVDGIGDQLQDSLSKNRLLLVVGKSSSAVFRNETPVEIGKKLNVASVLDGSVEQMHDRVRIQARIVRTSDGEQMWSKRL
jgi:adenylate cyclase